MDALFVTECNRLNWPWTTPLLTLTPSLIMIAPTVCLPNTALAFLSPAVFNFPFYFNYLFFCLCIQGPKGAVTSSLWSLSYPFWTVYFLLFWVWPFVGPWTVWLYTELSLYCLGYYRHLLGSFWVQTKASNCNLWPVMCFRLHPTHTPHPPHTSIKFNSCTL